MEDHAAVFVTKEVAAVMDLPARLRKSLRICEKSEVPKGLFYLVVGAAEILRPDAHPTLNGWMTSKTRYLILQDVHETALLRLPRRLRVRNPATRLHVSNDRGTIRRLLISSERRDPREGIIDAYSLGESLTVVMGDLVTRTFVWKSLPELTMQGLKPTDEFEIDIDGSFLHWISTDLHLGAMDFLEVSEPEYVAKIEISDLSRWLVGEAVRVIREQNGLYQTDFSGLSDRQIRRIENGESSLTAGAAQEMASALDMTLPRFIDELARTAASIRGETRDDAFSQAS